jgi:hypothetical protein
MLKFSHRDSLSLFPELIFLYVAVPIISLSKVDLKASLIFFVSLLLVLFSIIQLRIFVIFGLAVTIRSILKFLAEETVQKMFDDCLMKKRRGLSKSSLEECLQRTN